MDSPTCAATSQGEFETLLKFLQFCLGSEYADLFSEIPMLRVIPVYDIADGKALYIYTEHCHWASNDKPFIQCKCKRGQTLELGRWLILDEEYMLIQSKSKERWAKKPQIDTLRAQ